MKTTLMFAISIAMALLFALVLIAQDRYTLDLTVPRAVPPPPKSSFGCGPRLSAGSEGGGLVVQPVLPLAVEIVSLDKSAYTLGEELICLIRLTNVGDKPFRIPWSPDSKYRNTDCTEGIKGPPTAALTGSASLVLESDSGMTRKILLEGLYGRLSIPKTYRTLEPGESASIKFKVKVALYDPRSNNFSSMIPDFPQGFVATAEYDLDDTSQGNPYRTVYSKNRIELRILGQRVATAPGLCRGWRRGCFLASATPEGNSL